MYSSPSGSDREVEKYKEKLDRKPQKGNKQNYENNMNPVFSYQGGGSEKVLSKTSNSKSSNFHS